MTVYGGQSRVYFETVSAVTATPSVDPGSVRREGDEQYIYVYNAGNSQILPGNGVVLSLVTGYSCTLSSTTSVDLCFGVNKHSTITTGTYGWIMTRGFSQIKMQADNSAAAGQLVCLGADGLFALKSNSTGYPSPAAGKTMEAIASAGSGQAYITIW